MELLLMKWARSMEAAGRSPRTIRARTENVARCARAAGVPARDLTGEHVTAWLAGPWAPDTRLTYYRAAAAWAGWLDRQGLDGTQVLAGVERPRTPRGRPRPVSSRELAVMLADPLLTRREEALLVLGAFAGLRISEAARVRGTDIDAGRLRLVGKGGFAQELVLAPKVLQVAARMPADGWWFPMVTDPCRPMSPDLAGQHVKRVFRRNGVAGGSHRLRHWHATELVRAGVGLPVVARAMRHESMASTLRYVQVDEDQLRAALGTLPEAA
jgi:integrase